MTNDLISINNEKLRRNVEKFLQSPEGSEILDEFDTPWWLCVIAAMILFIAGLFMVVSIIWAPAGFKALWSVIRLEQFSVLKRNPKDHPELLQPLICNGIIIGPDQRHALVLGTFTTPGQYSADWLARSAARFAEIYSSGTTHTDEQALLELLRDDTYQSGRRRVVPMSSSSGPELVLFDAEVNLRQGTMSPLDSVLMAFVALPGEHGEFVQIPWKVVASAVQIRDV